MSSGSDTPTVKVANYYMSMHVGFCFGPVDAVQQIFIGEKLAWEGNVTTNTVISVTKPDLFGGYKKEGGIEGLIGFMLGSDTQVLSTLQAARLGKTPSTAPGFRGYLSLWFYGNGNSSSGFLWQSNNPYLKPIWAKVRRSPKGLSGGNSMIGNDANPAHIIYECLTNTDWGMGGPVGIIDVASFQAAATTLSAENFGMSLGWFAQSKIENFISEILDHINATFFINPETGQFTLKLIRPDYDVNTLPVLNENNCRVTAIDRKAWGETTNEIVVTWTNPVSEKEETVSAQNLANIGIQGQIVSDSRNYYGVRNRDLALNLAYRDLAAVSAPLAAIEIETDRSAWNLINGGVVKLTYGEDGVSSLILRIQQIDYGKNTEPTIKLSTMEDIFGNPIASYTNQVGTEWSNASTDPTPMDQARGITAPAYFTIQALGLTTVVNFQYPDVVAGMLASVTNNNDIFSYGLFGPVPQPTGGSVNQVIGTRGILGYATLQAALIAEPSSTVTDFGTVYGDRQPAPAVFCFIGDVADASAEIALIESVSVGGYVLKRGVLDTTPKAWASGTKVWFLSTSDQWLDTTTDRGSGQTIAYKLLSQTSKGILEQGSAPTVSVTLNDRPYLPLRPANVRVNGTGFGPLTVANFSSINVTWSNRNRLTEDTAVLGWADASVTPEASQTTTITVLRTNGTVLATHSGLSGTSFTIPSASFGSETAADIRVSSVRGSYTSLQSHTIRVTL